MNQLRAPRKAKQAMLRVQDAVRKHDLSEAWKQVAQALKTFPDYALALNARGILSLSAGNREEGIADLKKAIEVDPLFAPPYTVLAGLNNDDKQYDAALLLAERAEQIAPWDWRPHTEIARALLGKGGDHEKILQELIHAERLASGSPPENRSYVHYAKGSVMQNKNPGAAKFEFEQAMQEDPGGRFAKEAERAIKEMVR
jgi:tetratricopeptide (TPR) repeat protein